MAKANWFYKLEDSDGITTWDVYFGSEESLNAGEIPPVLEFETEANAKEVCELLKRLEAGPDTNSTYRQAWQDRLVNARKTA